MVRPRVRHGVVEILVVVVLLAVSAGTGWAVADHRGNGGGRSNLCSAFERRGRVPPVPAHVQRAFIDRCVHLNQVQVLGTHNSYHVQPSPELFGLLAQFDQALAQSLEYTHRPLTQQLDRGIRQFELDVFADPSGGLYADPAGQRVAPGPPIDRAALLEPGFKVLHVQDIDFRSRCPTLVACLTEIRAWSDTHPDHLPLMIDIEAKSDPIPDPLHLGFVVPHPIGGPELDALDGEIRSVFDPAHLITPDDVRQGFPTLRDAVTTAGWPALERARGKVLFTLDNTGRERDLYLAGRPSLQGRVLFVSAEPPSPAAAFVKLNDPVPDFDRIRSLVKAGFVVRTRADADTVQARTGDTTDRDAALASGAQWVSTDYPEPSPFGTGYVVRLPGGGPGRCDPVTTWVGCRADLLE